MSLWGRAAAVAGEPRSALGACWGLPNSPRPPVTHSARCPPVGGPAYVICARACIVLASRSAGPRSHRRLANARGAVCGGHRAQGGCSAATYRRVGDGSSRLGGMQGSGRGQPLSSNPSGGP